LVIRSFVLVLLFANVSAFWIPDVQYVILKVALNGHPEAAAKFAPCLAPFCAVAMTQAGTPQAVAMKISGHKTASMFQRYNIVATDDMRAALERTEQYRVEAAEKQKVVAMR
jgi:hypothetical protein